MLKRILSIRKGKFFISAAVSIILVVVLIVAAVNQPEVKAEIKNYTSEEKILEKQGKELEINNLSKENYAEEVLEPEELLNGTDNKMQETTDELLVAEEKQDSPEEIQEVQEQDKQENLQNVEEVSEPSKSSDTFFIELQPQSASAEEGRNAELTCYSKSAEETGHYEWQYYDLDKSEWQDIVDSDKYSVSKAVDKEERPLSKLTIKKLKKEDEKLFYRCLVYEGQEADANFLTSAQASVKVIPSGFTHMIVSYQKSCEVGTVLRVSDLMIGLLYPDDSIQFVSGLNDCSLVKTNDEITSFSGADFYEVMLGKNDLVLKYQTEKGTTIDTALTVTGIDSQKPVLTKTKTTDYKPSKSAQIPVTVAVTLEGSDNYTQIGELEYALVEESEKVSDQDYSKQSVYALQLDKNTNYTAYVKDEAGNSNCKNISLYVLDETAPVIKEITLANPEEDTWWNRNQIIVDAEDDTKMLFCFTLESDSKVTSGWINANVFEINQNGTYKVEVSDAAGNITSDTIEVKNVDAEAPTLEGLTAYYVPDVIGCTGQVIGFDLEGYPIYGADGSNSDIIGYNYEGKAIYFAEEKEENLFGYYLDESNLYGTLGEKVEDDTEELKTNAGGNTISGTLTKTKSSDTDSKETTAASTPTNTENTEETETSSTSQGSTGAEGKSGINSYVHIRYSANSDGSAMTTVPANDTAYMGIYSGVSKTAPTNISAYTWVSYKGNSYLHIRYSAKSDGSDMTTVPEDDTAYMGVYSGISKTAPTNISAYTWVSYKGENSYIYIRYSANSDGSAMTTVPTDDTVYIGVYTGTSKIAPTIENVYTWSKYVEKQEIKLKVTGVGKELIGTNVTISNGTYSYTKSFDEKLEVEFEPKTPGIYELSYDSDDGGELVSLDLSNYGSYEQIATYKTLYYLYNKGDECASLTGGIIAKTGSNSTVNDTKSITTKNSNNILVHATNYHAMIGNAFIYTANKVDLSDSKYIYAKVNVNSNTSGSGMIWISVTNVISTNMWGVQLDDATYVTSTKTGAIILKLPVNKLNGEYYISVGASSSSAMDSGYSYIEDANITELWLKK